LSGLLRVIVVAVQTTQRSRPGIGEHMEMEPAAAPPAGALGVDVENEIEIGQDRKPDFQWVRNPAAWPGAHDARVLALRAVLTF
jgi:hypothetical protein